MPLLIELHPIFANTVPAEHPNPVQCVVHDAFLESIRQADEEEAAEMLGETTLFSRKRICSASDDDVEMIDLPLPYTEASYSSTTSEVFGAKTGPSYTDDPGSFTECYDMIENMLTVDMDIITSCIIENDSHCSLPSLIDDDSDSDDSTDSDIEVAAPAPLSISQRLAPEPQPLTVAIIPQLSGCDATLLPRTFTNPLPAFLSSHLPPTLAAPKLNTQFTTTPKKRVHFHPNTSTRSFSSTSYSPDFESATFCPISPASPVNDLALRRQRKNAHLHPAPQPSSPEDRKAQGLRPFPRTCIAAFLSTQHTDSIDSETCPEHISLQSRYDTTLARLASMLRTFTSNVSSAQSSSTGPTLKKAHNLHQALLQDLAAYLVSNTSSHRTSLKMLKSTCADTFDATTFEETTLIFARCLNKLLLDFWAGERESVEKEVEELLATTVDC